MQTLQSRYDAGKAALLQIAQASGSPIIPIAESQPHLVFDDPAFPPRLVETAIAPGEPSPVSVPVENTGVVQPGGEVVPGAVVSSGGFMGWIKQNPVAAALIAGGAFLLISKGGKISGTGKKSLLPLVLVGGGLAVYLLSRKQQVAPVADEGLTDDQYQDYVNDNVPSPVIVAPDPVSAVIRESVAANNENWLINNFPQYKAKYALMSDGEIITLYQYLYGYVAQGLKLYQYPNSTGIYPDGNWNTVLFNQVQALKSKYGLVI